MLKQRYYRRVLFVAMIAVLFGFEFETSAQEKNVEPELSVSGIKLGDRESAKAFLSGYSARIEPDRRAGYYFYNKFATQVIKLTAASFSDPYFLMEIEVFAVGRSYQNRHFQTEKIGYFETESGIFIGHRESALSIIVGIPGVARRDQIGPNDLVKIKGIPTERVKTEDREMVTYSLAKIELPGETSHFGYHSEYEFYKNKLKRLTLKAIPANENKSKP